ncbi:MAG: TSUP family transporter, partial [Lacrimispora sp.]
FLGIGGGPVNLVVLFYFFSMDTKVAAQNSLYIIWISQIASLISTLVSKTVPEFSIVLPVLMVAGGILGGIGGHVINKRITSRAVERLFIALMMLIIGINIYNIFSICLRYA